MAFELLAAAWGSSGQREIAVQKPFPRFSHHRGAVDAGVYAGTPRMIRVRNDRSGSNQPRWTHRPVFKRSKWKLTPRRYGTGSALSWCCSCPHR